MITIFCCVSVPPASIGPVASLVHCWTSVQLYDGLGCGRVLFEGAEWSESVSRSIMGHALGGGEHGAYGSAPSLKLRSQWMAKIDLMKA